MTSTSSASMLFLDLDSTLGALLIGGLISAALYGITCSQTYVYYKRGQGDRLVLKLFVFCLWLIDTFDVVLNCHILYWYLVVNFANPLAMATPVWSILLHVSITCLSNFLVRGMFARRVWRLSNGNRPLIGFIIALSLLDLVCGVIITVKAFHDTFAGLQKLSVLMYLNFASGFSSDAAIALSLCYYLYKSKTGFGRTDSLIRILMVYTVNTGLLTVLDASMGLVFLAAMPNNFIYVAFYLQLSKLYVNAILASLNVRGRLRERPEDAVSIHLSRISESRYTGPSTAFAASQQQPDAKESANPLSIVESAVSQRSDVDSCRPALFNATQTV